MVTKSKSAKKPVKVGKLKLNKDTVKDLTAKDAKKVKGGAVVDRGGYSGAPGCPKAL
jgi:hypothetical protein